MGIVEEEADETAYWLEILAETGIVTQQAISDLHNEASQIVAMVIASIKTARSASRKA
jgi:four helix bundle protein